MENIAMFLVVATLAGLGWTMIGYAANWKKHRNDPNWEGFDKKSMRNDAIVGVVLGVAIVILQPVSAMIGYEYSIPVITDYNSFILGIAGLWPVVAIVDKLFVGFILGK